MTERRGQRSGDPYAGIPGRRLFVGVPLPPDAVEAVSAVVDEVRSAPLPAGARDVRWVRLDGLHLTLRFLGPTPEERVEPTIAAVDQAVESVSGPIDVELAGSGTFPLGRHPRTLWIGVATGVGPLSELAAATESALVRAGWPPDGRPFRAHLTLARSDGVSVAPLVAGRLAAAMTDRRIPLTVDRLGLFESVTGDGPARYLPLAIRNFA